MKNKKLLFHLPLLAILAAAQILVCCGMAVADEVTSPKGYLGHDLKEDYFLANHTQMLGYWKKLEEESDRIVLTEFGKTTEGRPMTMAIITSPENHKNLARYKEISRRLALAENLTDEEARALADEGKVVVWIDAGQHGTETVNLPGLTEMVYQLASQNDPETLRILNDVIMLAVMVNPDGLDLVSNWYMRKSDPTKRSTRDIPVLYQKYIGHDNNREYNTVYHPESQAIAQVLYHEWFPQILYDPHQSGPAGNVLFIGLMRDPSNPNLSFLMAPSTELITAAIFSRYVQEGKPGAVCETMASYQNWYCGGLRNVGCFHNIIAFMSEINGNPTPMDISFRPEKLFPNNDNPYPVTPQKWHIRQAVEYLITAQRAILDIASRYRDQFLFNNYRMGKNSIERGSQDYWTFHQKAIEEATSAIERDGVKPPSRRSGYPVKYYEMLLEPSKRDPRGYILPSDQTDLLTVTKFVNSLIRNGITVLRATQSFEVENKNYPAGSYAVMTAQPFRPFIREMFEPQYYPNDIPCPGGIPKPPYDNAGYTLAIQMGIQFDSILNGFDGPFEKVMDIVTPAPGKITGTSSSGYVLSHQVNDSFIAVNRLIKSGEEVYWLKDATEVAGKNFPAGAIYIAAKKSTAPKLENLATEIGLNFEGIATKPSGDAFRLKPVRVGLWDRYGGSMPSGWVQWMFEKQYDLPFKVVYPPELDAGNLSKKYDVLIFVEGAIPEEDPAEPRSLPAAEEVPPEYRDMLGDVTVSKTVPQLRQFLNEGGTILTIGSSTCLADHLGLPVKNSLIDKETGKLLPPEKFFAPGSVHQVNVDNTHPLAYGMPEKLNIYFNKCPVFELTSGEGVKKVAWYGNETPLLSGWIWGEQYLKDTVSVVDADVGKGKLFLFSPQITFRSQPHGAFKFLFNGIYYGKAELTKIK